MEKQKIHRIAFIKFTEHGKSYPMQCDRDDLVVGDMVLFIKPDGTGQCYYEGEITAIQYERWNCSGRVLSHLCDVNYEACDIGNNEFTINVEYEQTPETDIAVKLWRVENGVTNE